MIYKYIFLVVIILVLFYIYKKKENFDINQEELKINPTSKCWINSNNFPEAEKIFNLRDIIKQELINILDSDNWGIWSSDYKTTPVFTEMKMNEITERLEKNSGKIGSFSEPSWRLFGLILNKEELPNAKLCPKTMEILKNNSDRILNAGFSVLEPNCYIGAHQDFNNKFYRLHIPLIIPKINKYIDNSFVNKESSEKLCVLQVENDFRVWKENEFFIFDDTCLHNAWNPSDEIRIVLLIDLIK